MYMYIYATRQMLTVITSEWRLDLSFKKNVSYLAHWQKPMAISQYLFPFYFIVMEPPILADC